jgi:hypothetical protein
MGICTEYAVVTAVTARRNAAVLDRIRNKKEFPGAGERPAIAGLVMLRRGLASARPASTNHAVRVSMRAQHLV